MDSCPKRLNKTAECWQSYRCLVVIRFQGDDELYVSFWQRFTDAWQPAKTTADLRAACLDRIFVLVDTSHIGGCVSALYRLRNYVSVALTDWVRCKPLVVMSCQRALRSIPATADRTGYVELNHHLTRFAIDARFAFHDAGHTSTPSTEVPRITPIAQHEQASKLANKVSTNRKPDALNPSKLS